MPLAPLMVSIVAAVCVLGLIGYLLWPTWRAGGISDAAYLPVTVGGTLFNVPSAAVRMKVQRHSGPQDRIDLAFAYPALTPPEAAPRINAETAEEAPLDVDRIFLSISASGDAMAPEQLASTIYPRYVDGDGIEQDGLTGRAFGDATPYRNEDLFTATDPNMVTRCTRDTMTPGMCLSERRIGGADLTFRFPRAWLTQWRDVAAAMEQLATRLQGHRG
jgi:hypothetical protein